jgi:molybdenum cofactor synthesis domain-containing protein
MWFFFALRICRVAPLATHQGKIRMTTNPTACMILIGNELLSGRTQDKNLSWLSPQLNELGITMQHVHIIPDDAETIVATVNEARARYDYVFTTGGIGPTHDDITTECIGKAFNVAVERNAEAEAILRGYYSFDMLNAARLKMADIPVGATLIENPVSAAPAYKIENVFVLAGVPSIMQGMFAHAKHLLKGGKPTVSRQLELWIGEGTIAAQIEAVQHRFSAVEIGVYPTMKEGKARTTIVVRGTDEKQVVTAMDACETFCDSLGIQRITHA